MVPELTILRFNVKDHQTLSSNDMIGQCCIPAMSLKTGIVKVKYQFISITKNQIIQSNKIMPSGPELCRYEDIIFVQNLGETRKLIYTCKLIKTKEFRVKISQLSMIIINQQPIENYYGPRALYQTPKSWISSTTVLAANNILSLNIWIHNFRISSCETGVKYWRISRSSFGVCSGKNNRHSQINMAGEKRQQRQSLE